MRTQHYGVEYPKGIPDIPVDLSTNEMAKRLKLLATALQDMDQDPSGNSRYKGLAHHLSSEAFTAHSSREVRILVACCIADILRICAHEGPPYSEPTIMKDVLLFLIRQLRGLDSPKDPQYQRFFYLLENLSKVKTLMLALELEDAQDIIAQLLKHLLASISDNHDERSIGLMEELVVPLLQEADHVSWVVIDALMIHLMEPLKTSHRRSYRFAAEVTRKCEAELEQVVQNFISSALTVGNLVDVPLARHVLELIGELYVLVPELLTSIMPQLEIRLQSSSDEHRIDMVNLLTALFKSTNLSSENPTLFQAYLGRFNDIKPSVRILLIEASRGLISKHLELKETISNELIKRAIDIDESVRSAVINAVSGLFKKGLNYVSDPLIAAVVERIRDKKTKVRHEALLCLALMYRRNAFSLSDESVNEDDRQRVLHLQPHIMSSFWLPSLEDRTRCEKLLQTCLVPYQFPCMKRMCALVELFSSLEETGTAYSPLKAVPASFKVQGRVREMVREILELHKKEETFPDRDAQIQFYLKKLSYEYPDPVRYHEQLKEFYGHMVNDEVVFNLMEYIVGNEYTCKEVEKKVKELLVKTTQSFNNLKGAVTGLLERIAPLIFDSEAVECLENMAIQLFKGKKISQLRLSVPEIKAAERILALLYHLSRTYPHCFDSEKSINQILEIMKVEHRRSEESGLAILTNIAGEVPMKHPKLAQEIVVESERIVRASTDPKTERLSAKRAIKAIAMYTAAADQCDFRLEIFNGLFKELEEAADIKNYKAGIALSAIGKMAFYEPLEMSASVKALISSKLVKPIILFNENHSHDFDEDLAWVHEDQLSPECLAKIGAIKLMVNWLAGLRSTEEDYAERTLKMLKTILITHGDLNRIPGKISKAEKGYLRLCAEAKQNPNARKFIKEEIPQAIREIVRKRRNLAGNNPSNPQLVSWSMARVELCLPSLVYLLSHHSKLKHNRDLKMLQELRDCLWLVLEQILVRDGESLSNVEMVYRLFQCVKEHKDAQNPDDDDQNKKGGNLDLYAPEQLTTEEKQKYGHKQAYHASSHPANKHNASAGHNKSTKKGASPNKNTADQSKTAKGGKRLVKHPVGNVSASENQAKRILKRKQPQSESSASKKTTAAGSSKRPRKSVQIADESVNESDEEDDNDDDDDDEDGENDDGDDDGEISKPTATTTRSGRLSRRQPAAPPTPQSNNNPVNKSRTSTSYNVNKSNGATVIDLLSSNQQPSTSRGAAAGKTNIPPSSSPATKSDNNNKKQSTPLSSIPKNTVSKGRLHQQNNNVKKLTPAGGGVGETKTGVKKVVRAVPSATSTPMNDASSLSSGKKKGVAPAKIQQELSSPLLRRKLMDTPGAGLNGSPSKPVSTPNGRGSSPKRKLAEVTKTTSHAVSSATTRSTQKTVSSASRGSGSGTPSRSPSPPPSKTKKAGGKGAKAATVKKSPAAKAATKARPATSNVSKSKSAAPNGSTRPKRSAKK